MRKVLAIAISTFFILSVFLHYIDFMSTEISYYNNFHKEYEISKVSGLEEKWIEDASDSIVSFIKTGEKSILEKYFNEKEVKHMEDVYDLFSINKLVYKIMFAISVILIAVYLFNFKYCIFEYLKRYLLKCFVVIIGFFGVLSAVFTVSFEYFHKIFFANDLWLLDYETDYMIRILPEEFFFTMFVNILLLTTITIVCVYFAICLLKNKIKCRNNY